MAFWTGINKRSSASVVPRVTALVTFDLHKVRAAGLFFMFLGSGEVI